MKKPPADSKLAALIERNKTENGGKVPGNKESADILSMVKGTLDLYSQVCSVAVVAFGDKKLYLAGKMYTPIDSDIGVIYTGDDWDTVRKGYPPILVTEKTGGPQAFFFPSDEEDTESDEEDTESDEEPSDTGSDQSEPIAGRIIALVMKAREDSIPVAWIANALISMGISLAKNEGLTVMLEGTDVREECTGPGNRGAYVKEAYTDRDDQDLDS